MKSRTCNGEVRSSEKDFETFTVGSLRYSRFAPRLRARRFNCGIRAEWCDEYHIDGSVVSIRLMRHQQRVDGEGALALRQHDHGIQIQFVDVVAQIMSQPRNSGGHLGEGVDICG